MNWQAKADKATAALRKFGAAVALVRVTQGTPANAWDPPAQTEASYQGKGLLLSYAAHLVDGIVKGLKHPGWPPDPWQALHRLAQSLCGACSAGIAPRSR